MTIDQYDSVQVFRFMFSIFIANFISYYTALCFTCLMRDGFAKGFLNFVLFSVESMFWIYMKFFY